MVLQGERERECAVPFLGKFVEGLLDIGEGRLGGQSEDGVVFQVPVVVHIVRLRVVLQETDAHQRQHDQPCAIEESPPNMQTISSRRRQRRVEGREEVEQSVPIIQKERRLPFCCFTLRTCA